MEGHGNMSKHYESLHQTLMHYTTVRRSISKMDCPALDFYMAWTYRAVKDSVKGVIWC